MNAATGMYLNFGSPKKVHTVFVLQDHFPGYQNGLGISAIFVGSTPTSASTTFAKTNVSATGFFKLDAMTEGQYLALRRLT